jgi:hypothetical protein
MCETPAFIASTRRWSDIESERPELLGELRRERQPDVTQTDDTDPGTMRTDQRSKARRIRPEFEHETSASVDATSDYGPG